MKRLNTPLTVSGDRKRGAHNAWCGDGVTYSKMYSEFLNDLHGWGNDGVMSAGANASNSLRVTENDTPDMKIKIASGWGFDAGELAQLAADEVTGDQTAPSSDPRIDLVSLDSVNDLIVITEGAEAASPSAPATPADHIRIAYIHHVVGETMIEDTDGGHGWIELKRNLIQGAGQE